MSITNDELANEDINKDMDEDTPYCPGGGGCLNTGVVHMHAQRNKKKGKEGCFLRLHMILEIESRLGIKMQLFSRKGSFLDSIRGIKGSFFICPPPKKKKKILLRG